MPNVYRDFQLPFPPHLVLIFISSSLLGSDSSPPKLSGFLKACFPRRWHPTQVMQLATKKEQCLSPVSKNRTMTYSIIQVRGREVSTSAFFMAAAPISSVMGSRLSVSLGPPSPSSLPSPHLPSQLPLSRPLTFSCHFIPKAKGKTLKAFHREVMRSRFFVRKITLNPVAELER